MNLRHCPGCKRDLPRSMFPKHGRGYCFHCVFNGPGEDKENVLNERNEPGIDEELVYVKHKDKILNALKERPDGLTRKELSRETGMTTDALYPYLRKLTDKGKCVMKKEVIDNRLTNVYYPPEAVSEQTNQLDRVKVIDEAAVPNGCEGEVQETPIEVPIYTARELANTYLEGFKDGFNTAVQEIGSSKEDLQEGQG